MTASRPPLLVVTGTGTGIGKTVVAAGLVRAWGRRRPAMGVKPIESGGTGDNASLERASTFHVTRLPPPYLLERPVSPHLAAAAEGRTIDLGEVVRWVERTRDTAEAPGVVLELPGGLFSPLGPTTTNCDLALALTLGNTKVVVVVPDRLGVLHDAIAAVTAADARGLAIAGLVVVAPAEADASTGTNAGELGKVIPVVPVLASLPRLDDPERADLGAVLERLDL